MFASEVAVAGSNDKGREPNMRFELSPPLSLVGGNALWLFFYFFGAVVLSLTPLPCPG